jgi:hypothetical protein
VSFASCSRLLEALGTASASGSKTLESAFDLLAQASGSGAHEAYYAVDERIHVNADGHPVQLVVRMDRSKGGYGFIFNPRIKAYDGADRRRRTLSLVRSVSDLLGLSPPNLLESKILPVLRGRCASTLEDKQSAVWIAIASCGRRCQLKLYISLDGFSTFERWRRFGDLLVALGWHSALSAYCGASATVTAWSTPTAVGIDFDGENRPSRVKLYVANEVCDASWLRRWYSVSADNDAYDAMAVFQDLCGLSGFKSYHRCSFFVAASFQEDSDRVTLKTDIPICRWLANSYHAGSLLSNIASTFGLPKIKYPISLAALNRGSSDETVTAITDEVIAPKADKSVRARAALQLIGLGEEPPGNLYVNVYLRPPE